MTQSADDRVPDSRQARREPRRWLARSSAYRHQPPEDASRRGADSGAGPLGTLKRLSREAKQRQSRTVVLTVGHSTRSLEKLIELLKVHEITAVLDVRTIPRSRTNPQFNQETLPHVLKAAGIGYQHMPGLGGLRHARPDSPNMGWHNASFRGFADYMQTAEFAVHLQALIERANENRVVLMCAEAVPWRCHRSLIADALSAHGIAVEHIIGRARAQPHMLTPWASVRGTAIVYPIAKARRYEAEKKRPSKTSAPRSHRLSAGKR